MIHATADVSSPPDGALFDAIAREVGTPVYVYDARAIDRAYRALDAALTGCPHAIHYALKANSTLAVVQLLRHLGAGADANSGAKSKWRFGPASFRIKSCSPASARPAMNWIAPSPSG